MFYLVLSVNDNKNHIDECENKHIQRNFMRSNIFFFDFDSEIAASECQFYHKKLTMISNSQVHDLYYYRT